MPTPLIHELPMRWADIDTLNHVNNVVYLDYATEASDAHVAAGELPAREVRAVSVEFFRPLLLSRTPIRVSSRWDESEPHESVLVQDIAPAGGDTAFARVTTRPRADVPPFLGGEGIHYDLRVRRSDLAADGTATTTKVFEYAQESRIASVAQLHQARGGIGGFVVARVDLTLGRPFRWRPEPYATRTVVTHVGRSSFTLSTLFEDGLHGRADAVLVGFDPDSQTSRPLTPDERSLLG